MDYRRLYDSIISKAKSENRSKVDRDNLNYIYYEAHHIIPKCMGGKGKTVDWKTHPNIVLLTAKEHYICHMLLVQMYPHNNSLASSFLLMCNSPHTKTGNTRYIPSSKMYEFAKLSKSRAIVTKETRDKQAKAKIGNKNGSGNKGKTYGPQSEQRRLNISIANKGRTAANGGRKAKIESLLECPYCKKVGNNNGGMMKRWHFNNCKLKT